MNPATLLLERLDGDGVDVSIDGDNVRFRATLAPIKTDTLSELKEHKAAIMALLRDAPSFTDDEVRALVAFYCVQSREDRLRIHRHAAALRTRRGWPYWIADLAATQAARDATNDLPPAQRGGNTKPDGEMT